jgi:hypothetical protein
MHDVPTAGGSTRRRASDRVKRAGDAVFGGGRHMRRGVVSEEAAGLVGPRDGNRRAPWRHGMGPGGARPGRDELLHPLAGKESP